MIVTTQSGSIYRLDPEDQSWERILDGGVGRLRTDGGYWLYLYPLEVGKPLKMICPPLNPPYSRHIETSRVISIEEEE